MPSYQGEERFYLHYNFPPFCTGEARPIRGTSRREVGHGNLAQRGLKSMVPDDCPYTVRVVSEVLESNGSSSMATVCSGTMALMDAGIQIKKPVSGIAMGLISDGDRYAVLSDILGDEDHLGDMDFKVTGTVDGITACQMDIKIKGLSYEILDKALKQARDGRLHILEKISETIDKPNESVKAHAPKMVKMIIDGDYIGAVIGPGGKVIQEMQKETGTTIVIEEEDEKGIIEILGTNQEMIDSVIEKIDNITFKQDGSVTGSEFLLEGGTITSDVTILGSVAANSILTPATIGGVASTEQNSSSSIDSKGFARFVSASIGSFGVSNNAFFSPPDDPVTPNFFISGAATGTDYFISSSKFQVKADGTIEASAGVITSGVTIDADLTANAIRTPAIINEAASTPENASSSIDSQGFARFQSASIAGFVIDPIAIVSTDGNLILSLSLIHI